VVPSGAADWEDRAAVVLLRFLSGAEWLLSGAGEAKLKFRFFEEVNEKGSKKKGIKVFRVYGGVEAPVGELWIGDVARFKVSKEELRRFVEEARRKAPDLSGIKKIWQTLAWFATDVSFAGRRIEAATADTRQAAWYVALFGEPVSIRGRANVTEEGVKPNVTMRWPREVLDSIIAEEGKELEPLLGRAVKSWRELVDAVEWSRVLERVEELADKLKPWIGPEEMSNAERESHMRRMLGELALLAYFAEARRGMDDGRWREERAKRLARAVEALSGGKIRDEYANELAQVIIYYAEGYKEYAGERIKSLAEKVGVTREEVWGLVEFVNSEMYCLARDCARDAVVRKFMEPALELIMLDKALNKEFDRDEALRVKFSKEEALLLFGEMYATALAGDGHVGPREVMLVVGGELGGGAALLRLATLHLLNQLLSNELKFNVRAYVGKGVYNIAARGENATRVMRLLAVSAPSVGGGYLSPKFDQFVEEAQVEVRPGDVRLTKSGVAADLIISVGGVEIKYNVYLRNNVIMVQFRSTDRSRVELAARLLRLAGVAAEVKEEGGRDEWYVVTYTDMLAAGREELRKALAKVVETAAENGWVDADKAKRWLEKLEGGLTLKEGWPKYLVRLIEGALVVRFSSTSRESLEEVAREFKAMGLEEGTHFTVGWDGEKGYVYLKAEGVKRLAWASIHGEREQRLKAAEFLKFLEERAKAEGAEVLKKLEALVEEGRGRGSLRLAGLERDGVKVLGVEAEEKGDKLYVTIKAEVDGAAGKYKLTIRRQKDGKRRFYFYVKGEEAVARAVKLMRVLTGEEPSVSERRDGRTVIGGSGRRIDALAQYEELREAIERWSNRTSKRRSKDTGGDKEAE